jgi:adenylate cyclase
LIAPAGTRFKAAGRELACGLRGMLKSQRKRLGPEPLSGETPVASDRVERRLTAILAADVVGYSRLMGADEEGTLARLKAHRRELVEPVIAGHRGRIVKTTGDGLLVEFASVVDATRCAVELQRAMPSREAGVADNRQIRFRIGVTIGDIIVENGDIFGDGVNIAARIEALAEPGGICVSDDAYRQVRGKLDVAYLDTGEQNLKNIVEPVRVYRVRLNGAPAEATQPVLALPEKPSIAVLPFSNMSGDPGQDYFADGVVEEIITALSHMRWLFVIARASSFIYKGRAVDVKQVGRELGVRYVLEGSFRKSGNKVRITGQLIDASTGAHIWADRFDGALEDVFDLQDQVTESVVSAIAPKLEQAEIERARRKPTESLDAYDYYLRGLRSLHRWTREDNRDAVVLFNKAIELDPNFASAYGMAARCYSQRRNSSWVTDRAFEVAEAQRLARRAAELGQDNAVALATAGIALAYVADRPAEGLDLIDRALGLDPNFAWAWMFRGWTRAWSGEPDAALEDFTRAIRLSPQDPHIFAMQSGVATAHFFARRYDEALTWARIALRSRPDLVVSNCVIAASCALLGQQDEAAKAIAVLRRVDPAMRVSNLHNNFPIRDAEQLARWAEGLRRAGLPE